MSDAHKLLVTRAIRDDVALLIQFRAVATREPGVR
jgi:hypothetical protein